MATISCSLVARFHQIFFKTSYNINYARNCIYVNFSKNLKSPLYILVEYVNIILYYTYT